MAALLTVATTLVLDSGVQCRASLTYPEAAPPESTQILLGLGGSGLYSLVDMGPPALIEEEMATSRVAYLAVDKPGVLGSSGDTLDWDLEAFSSYTPEDLVGCTESALIWAQSQPMTAQDGLILMGHSEGSLVLLNMLASWERAQTDNIDLLVLSGMPLQGMEQVLVHQWDTKRIARRMRKEQALEAEDPRRYIEEGPGISTQGLQAWMDTPDPKALLSQVIRHQIPTLIQHGLQDDAVPPDELLALAAHAQAPWMCVQFYAAGHNGDLSMVVARLVWVDAALGLSPRQAFMSPFLSPDPSLEAATPEPSPQ